MSAVIQTESGPVSKPRKTSSQPLHAAQIADALLKLRTLQDLCGLGKTSLYAKEKAGELELIRIGKRCTRVRASEAQRFLQALGKEVAA